MRFSFLAIAFTAAVAASPHPWAEPQMTDVPTTLPTANVSLNATRTHRHNPHKEPTPTFKLGCDCRKPIIPVDQLSPAEVREVIFVECLGEDLDERATKRKGTHQKDEEGCEMTWTNCYAWGNYYVLGPC